MNLSVGLQLYTVREDMKNDYFGTLEKIAGMGYQGVEFFDYGGYPAKVLKDKLQSLGLKAVNTHVTIDRMEKDADLEIENALELGLKDITIPMLPEERRRNAEDYFSAARILQELGTQCKKKGLQLHYHNHYFEFDKFGDVCGMDIILGNTDPENLKIELDTFWVTYVSIDPAEYLKSHSERISMVHLKDMYKDADRKSEISPFAEIGNGIMDIMGIIDTCGNIGVKWLIVEQDRSRRPAMESIKISIDYLKHAGIVERQTL